MKSTPRLHATIVHVLSQHRNWLDRRHLKPLAWMIAGLLPSQVIRRRPGLPMCRAARCTRRVSGAASIAGSIIHGSTCLVCIGC
jgi:hypothetical protein